MRWLVISALLLALAACGQQDKPFSYTDQREMADRPGLFTGRAGAIVLYHD